MQALETLGVGQVEVEQDAVEALEAGRGGLSERAPALDVHARARQLELLLDDQRVAVVVLDEEDAHPVGGLSVHRRRGQVQWTVHLSPPA